MKTRSRVRLGAAKSKLLKRLANVGTKLVSDSTLDSFSSMSVKDCSQYVSQVERFMVHVSNPAHIRFWDS
jgi:hypothetical protein